MYDVLIEDFEAEIEEVIYTEKGSLPVFSAAWSPDGSQILMALRWYVSDEENGAKLVLYDVQTAESKDLFVLDMAQQEAVMGNALWTPSGKQVLLYLQVGSESGIYLLSMEGTDLQRLPNSVPGERPRYWSTDEEWIVTVTEEGALYALGADGELRLPLSEVGAMQIYDQRYDPWRLLSEARCDAQEDSWWKCK
jgi:Tol biopolymer transport system component